MKITFLGTGTSQGVPIITCRCPVCTSTDAHDNRLRCSIHIATDDGQSLVVDTGPDFRQQMLRTQIQKLDAVLLTHQHKDHTAGMDDIRAFYFVQQMQDIPIYARNSVIEQLKQEFAYIFAKKKYPGVPSVAINYIENKPFKIKNTEIIPIEILHYKLPVFGFRIGDFTYLTDVNYIPQESFEKITGTKILVLGVLQKEDHISHFNLAEGLEVVRKIKPKQAYFTHISHKMGLHREVNRELSDNVALAYDGLCLEM